MTREEALIRVEGYLTSYLTLEDSGEIDEIMEALELDPCEDTISRAGAIKRIQEKSARLTNLDTINGLCGAVAILFEMPSVQPANGEPHGK